MDSIYDQYRYNNSKIEKEQEKTLEFFILVNLFSNFTYEQRVEFMEYKYGEIYPGKVIHFGDKCSVKISEKTDKKFNFEFKAEEVDFNCFLLTNPEFAEKFQELITNEIKKQYPEYDNLEALANEKRVSNQILNNVDFIKSYNLPKFNKD